MNAKPHHLAGVFDGQFYQILGRAAIKKPVDQFLEIEVQAHGNRLTMKAGGHKVLERKMSDFGGDRFSLNAVAARDQFRKLKLTFLDMPSD